MNWYRWRWWRIALSAADPDSIWYGGTTWDTAGRWHHVAGPLWVLVSRRDRFGGGAS